MHNFSYTKRLLDITCDSYLTVMSMTIKHEKIMQYTAAKESS